MADDAVTIYHNPDCGTSRNTLALLRASGCEPEVIEYLKSPPDRDTLRQLAARAGMSIRELLRVKEKACKVLALDAPGITDEQVASQMLAHPVLINRPLVVTPLGVKLCRPSDVVLDLLSRWPANSFVKEDGSPVLVDARVDAQDPGLRAALEQAQLPTADLAEPGCNLYRYETLSGERVGYGGFELHGSEVLLRSLVVLSAVRGRGIGSGLLALLSRRAFDAGARRAWLLTMSAAAFFEKAGFKEVDRAEAPAAITGSRQAATLCPASAKLLARKIRI